MRPNETDIEIRPLSPEGLPTFLRLNAAFNGEGCTSPETARRVMDNNPSEIVLIAYADGHAVGFCAARVSTSVCYDWADGEVAELYVEEAFRRRGIASLLMREMEKVLFDRGVRDVTLCTSIRNTNAQRFYESIGYVDKRRMVYSKRIESLYPRSGDDCVAHTPGMALMESAPMRLQWINEAFCVAKLAGLDGVEPGRAFTFLSVTDREISLVCRAADVPTNALQVNPDWVAMRIVGVLDFSLVGILAPIARILAEAGIGIFAISTYDTDYLFVKASDQSRAEEALRAGGYSFT